MKATESICAFVQGKWILEGGWIHVETYRMCTGIRHRHREIGQLEDSRPEVRQQRLHWDSDPE